MSVYGVQRVQILGNSRRVPRAPALAGVRGVWGNDAAKRICRSILLSSLGKTGHTGKAAEAWALRAT